MRKKSALLRGSLALLALVLFLPPTATLAQTCPTSSLNCGAGTIESAEPSRSISCSDFGSSGSASYDLVTGVANATGSGDDISGGGFVQARDEYRVLGVPEGTVLDFFAELHVSGGVSLGCGYFPSGSVSGAIFESVSNFAQASASGSSGGPDCEYGFCCGTGAGLDSLLRVPIHRAGGEVFSLRIEVGTSVRFGQTGVGAQLRFSGLPPGASVVSCQGFVQEVPVAAVPVTWGRVKGTYR